MPGLQADALRALATVIEKRLAARTAALEANDQALSLLLQFGEGRLVQRRSTKNLGREIAK